MDESKNGDCVDQYGEPRIQTQPEVGGVGDPSPPEKGTEECVIDLTDDLEPVEENEEPEVVEISLDTEEEEEEEAAAAVGEEETSPAGPNRDAAAAAEFEEEKQEHEGKDERVSGGDGGHAARPPKKRKPTGDEEKREGGREKEVKEIPIRLGDLVWGRLPNSCFYPAVVTMDHFKFFTKIVKAEPGFTSHDPETGEPRAFTSSAAARKQYHVQFLADNRRHWLADEFVMAFRGIRHYEQLAINDLKNFNKIYKPKSEQMKNSWKEALLTAQYLEGLDPRERLRRCELARLEDRGGKALIKKYESDQRQEEQQQRANSGGGRPGEPPDTLAAARSPSTSPAVTPKKNSSPASGEPHRKSGGSSHYNRRDEMDYKMHRLGGSGQARKRKISLTEEKEATGRPKPVLFETPPAKPTFNRSFKIKKMKPVEGISSLQKDNSSPPEGEKRVVESDARKGVERNEKEKEKEERNRFAEREEEDVDEKAPKISKKNNIAVDAIRKKQKSSSVLSPGSDAHKSDAKASATPDTSERVKKKKMAVEEKGACIESPESLTNVAEKSVKRDENKAAAYEPTEGALVWAKMRGYPYWPAVVARDPNNGEYASHTDAFFKPMKKFHVLFLEYGNQRAWVNSASIKEYKGIAKFNSDKAEAPKGQRADYTPNKRHAGAFSKAVSYAEELRGGPDGDRLERVLLRYGWVMVGEAASPVEEQPPRSASATSRSSGSSSATKKPQKLGSGLPRPNTKGQDSEELVNRSTDSETDGPDVTPTAGKTSLVEAAKVRGSGSSNTMDTAAGRSTAGGSGRRSSTEAESRLDPGRDDVEAGKQAVKGGVSAAAPPPPPVTTSKSAKRQSSAGRDGAGVVNGGNKSGISDAEESEEIIRPPPAKKKSSTPGEMATNTQADTGSAKKDKEAAEKPGKSGTAVSKTPKAAARAVPASSVISPMGVPVPKTAPMTPSGTGDKEEFPRVGDLVWGRMAGFPYWPAFVTRSPEGMYRKEGASSKPSFHVQFFGWNDESGWVSSVIEFEGLDSFQLLGAKKKSDKSMNPVMPMKKKWEKAARDAEDTMGLSRQERLDQYLVSYADKVRVGGVSTDSGVSSAKRSPAAAAAASPSRKSAASSPARKATSSPQIPARPSKSELGTAANPSPKRSTSGKPCPASKKAGATSVSASDSPPRRSGVLPKGWKTETRDVNGKEVLLFFSPDGKEFSSKAAAQRYISQEKAGHSVKYVEDPSLPAGWKCQKIQSSIFFFSPMGERFDSRKKVTERMRADNYSEAEIAKVLAADNCRPAPKCVKIKRGEKLLEDPPESYEDDSEDDCDQVKYLPDNVTKYRWGGPYDSFLDLEKLFDGPNVAGGIIDMVQLPDIFLRHPTVLVQEADNEMTISDVDTGEFIAKKIIYD